MTFQGDYQPQHPYQVGDVVSYRPEPPWHWKAWEWVRTRILGRGPRERPAQLFQATAVHPGE